MSDNLNHDHAVNEAQEQDKDMNRAQRCCCPSGCVVGEPLDMKNLSDAVTFTCSNTSCAHLAVAHHMCCMSWRQHQPAQQLKPCPCGIGFMSPPESVLNDNSLRAHALKSNAEDEFSTQQNNSNSNRRRRRRNSYRLLTTTTTTGGTTQPSLPQQQQQQQGMNNASVNSHGIESIALVLPGRPRARTLSGVPNGYGNARQPTSPNHNYNNNNSYNYNNRTMAGRVHSDGGGMNHHNHGHNGNGNGNTGRSFFTDPQVQQNGSIFASRNDMSDFYAVLPAHKVNGFHIKMEDDCPQGNDDTRIFALTNLGKHNQRQVPCVMCQQMLQVFNKYPLVNGTFFISPVNHRNQGTALKYDSRPAFMHAICMWCCEMGSDFVQCGRCTRTGWLPHGTLLLGGVYSFDVLSCVFCCAPTCSNCAQAMPLENRSFANNSECVTCQRCGHRDFHYIRQVDHCTIVSPPPPDSTQKVSLDSSVSSCASHSSAEEYPFVLENTLGRGLLSAIEDTSPSVNAMMQVAS